MPIDLGRKFVASYDAKEVVEHVLAWPDWLAGLRRALVSTPIASTVPAMVTT